MLFDSHTEDPNYNPLPEERPGGFEWGAAGAAQAAEGEQRENQWIQKTVKTVWMQQLQKETSQWGLHCNLSAKGLHLLCFTIMCLFPIVISI